MTISTITKQRSVGRKRLLERTATTLSMMDQGDDAGVHRLWQGADDATVVRLLTTEEQERYLRAHAHHEAVKKSRDSAASVLEWLVFPEDAAAELPKEYGIKRHRTIDGWHNESFVIDPMEELKDGGTPKQWKAFWKKTSHAMASLPDLVQAEESLYSLLVERRELYTNAEIGMARVMQGRIATAMRRRAVLGSSKMIDGLLLDTRIQFYDDHWEVDILHHGAHEGKNYYHIFFDTRIQDMPIKKVAKQKMIRHLGEIENATHYTGKRLLEALFGKRAGFLDLMEHNGLAERIQEQLKAAGIDVTITTPPIHDRTKDAIVTAVYEGDEKVRVMMDVSKSPKQRYSTLGVRKEIYDRHHNTASTQP